MRRVLQKLRNNWLRWQERRLRFPIRDDVPVERLGTAYGGWIIPAGHLGPDSVVCLAGAGTDISFDVAVAARYGCQVHILDPTPRAAEHFQQVVSELRAGRRPRLATSEDGHYPAAPPEVAELLSFEPVGLWDETTLMRFYEPANPEHVSHSVVNLQRTVRFLEVSVVRLGDWMRDHGIDQIDLLKLDIEGAEYSVIDSLLDDRLPVRVLCVEFDESLAHHLDRHYARRIEATLRRLLAAGYEIVGKEPDSHDYTLRAAGE